MADVVFAIFSTLPEIKCSGKRLVKIAANLPLINAKFAGK